MSGLPGARSSAGLAAGRGGGKTVSCGGRPGLTSSAADRLSDAPPQRGLPMMIGQTESEAAIESWTAALVSTVNENPLPGLPGSRSKPRTAPVRRKASCAAPPLSRATSVLGVGWCVASSIAAA